MVGLVTPRSCRMRSMGPGPACASWGSGPAPGPLDPKYGAIRQHDANGPVRKPDWTGQARVAGPAWFVAASGMRWCAAASAGHVSGS